MPPDRSPSASANASRYREIEVRGGPRELGRQAGEAARGEIRGFIAAVLERPVPLADAAVQRALEIARSSIAHVEHYSPELLDEVRGMAEGAGVSVEMIMLLQVRNQLHARSEAACTSLALPPDRSIGRGSVVAQNWDNDPDLDRYTIVLTRKPTGRPALMTVGQAGLIAYIGLNDAGIGAALNALPGPSRATGVPHYFTVRGILDSTTLDGAVSAVRRAERAISANIMLSTPQGPADLEVTVDDVHVLREPGPHGAITHSNHGLHPALRANDDGHPELAQSRARLRRMDALLSGSVTGIDGLKSALRDHRAYPRSICRHVSDDPETGFWRTVLSVIIEPDDRRMQVSRGAPCEHPYEAYLLA